MKVLIEFVKDGIIHGVTNETYICLISKKMNSAKIKDFWPISLVTSLFKIISYVLSLRLKGVLADTISEKAYDHVEWGFLDFVLKKKRFGSLWRKWILVCLSSVSFSVSINGRLRRKFKGSRGLRQGDPVSSFLFTLVVDVFGRLIDKAKEYNVIHSFFVGRDKVEVTHLQFADDTLFFMEANPNVFLNYLKLVEVFGSVSGLRVNLTRSTLLGINTNEEMLQNLASILGCGIGVWLIKYLGLPLGGNP